MIGNVPASRSLRFAVVGAALSGALTALIVAMIVAGIADSRLQHSTLDAASVAVRDAVGTGTAQRTAPTLAAMRSSLETWGVAAAAFDRNGTLIAGDERLRADGLPEGRASAPLSSRQVALVETRDGYVLLTIDPAVTARLRWSVAAGVVVTFVLVWIVSMVAGGRWAAIRGETAELLREGREERLRAFLAEAAHELRTPLAIAIGYVGILQRGGLGDADLAARIVNDVAAEHTRLQQLVERILLLARLDAVPGDGSAVSDVARVAVEAVALVRPLDPARSIAIEAGAPVWAAIAPDELRDALRNVIENALRYAPDAPIRVVIAASGSDIKVTVIDTGPGMDAFSAEHALRPVLPRSGSRRCSRHRPRPCDRPARGRTRRGQRRPREFSRGYDCHPAPRGRRRTRLTQRRRYRFRIDLEQEHETAVAGKAGVQEGIGKIRQAGGGRNGVDRVLRGAAQGVDRIALLRREQQIDLGAVITHDRCNRNPDGSNIGGDTGALFGRQIDVRLGVRAARPAQRHLLTEGEDLQR